MADTDKVQEVEVNPNAAIVAAAMAEALAAPTRSYSQWQAPASVEAAAEMLLPAKGRGLIRERAEAVQRVNNNRAKYGLEDVSSITAGAVGWHDRTVTKCVRALEVVYGGITFAEALQDVAVATLIRESAHLTGYGTPGASTKPGRDMALALAPLGFDPLADPEDVEPLADVAASEAGDEAHAAEALAAEAAAAEAATVAPTPKARRGKAA